MKGFFRRLFHIYAGEEKNAFLFATLGFLWALGVTSGLKFADALFLLHIGAHSLPTAYIITSCMMMVLAIFLLKAFDVISAKKIFISVLSTGILFYFIVYLCFLGNIGIESEWLWFALRIFGSLLFSICITSYWTYVDQYYHLQDAKRLYTLFSSAIFLGVATTGIIMRSGIFDFQHLTLIIIGLLLLAIYWINKIATNVQPIYDDTALEPGGDQEETSMKFLFQAILGSKFTLLLMASNFLIFVLMVITEYSYLSAFDARFDPVKVVTAGEEQDAVLTQFLGQLLASVSIFNLVFGLFVYSRLIRNFGISNLVLLTPLVLVINFTGWSLYDALMFPIVGFFVVEGLLYIVDDNNFTLLLNAVPAKLKYRIRLIIESLFEPIGMLISSLMISLIPINSKILGLCVASIALIVALLLRRQYIKAIYINLLEHAVHFQRTFKDWFYRLSPKRKKMIERRLLALVQIGDPEAQQLALEGILSTKEPSLLHSMLHLQDYLNDQSKEKFIKLISQANFESSDDAVALLQEWFAKTEDPALKGRILFYLAKAGLLTEKEAEIGLTSDDLPIYSAALLSLYMHDKNIYAPQLAQMLAEEYPRKRVMALRILSAAQYPEDLEWVLSYLEDDSIEVAREAAKAVANLIEAGQERIARHLLEKLQETSDTEIRQHLLIALGKVQIPLLSRDIVLSSGHFRPSERRLAETVICQLGTETVPYLLAIVKDQKMPDRCRILACRALGRLDLPLLRAHIYQIIDEEIDRAAFYFYFYQTIQKDYPQYDLHILEDDLFSSFRSVLDVIIQFLAVADESEDCELLSLSLRSPNSKVRSQVIETLEKSCEPHIFSAVYPLIADLPASEKMQVYLKRGHRPLSLEQLLDKMSHSSIQGDQIVAIALKYRLNMAGWREALKEQLAKPDEILHHFVYEILET